MRVYLVSNNHVPLGLRLAERLARIWGWSLIPRYSFMRYWRSQKRLYAVIIDLDAPLKERQLKAVEDAVKAFSDQILEDSGSIAGACHEMTDDAVPRS